jgi:hypothetical protein
VCHLFEICDSSERRDLCMSQYLVTMRGKWNLVNLDVYESGKNVVFP